MPVIDSLYLNDPCHRIYNDGSTLHTFHHILAGPGLGKSVAIKFAKQGFAIALMNRSESSVAPAQDGIRALGGKSLFVPTDATNFEQLKASFATVKV